MKNSIYILVINLLLSLSNGYAQTVFNGSDYIYNNKIGVGKQNSSLTAPSSWLEIGKDSTSKGMILPRVVDTANIASPIKGLFIYQIKDNQVYYRDRFGYRQLSTGAGYLRIGDSTIYYPYASNPKGYLITEVDPAANAKTITFTAGTGVGISNSTAQTIGSNPTLTISALNTAALWNANQIRGFAVAATTPTTGQVLQYDGTQYVPFTIGIGGTVSSVGLSLPSDIYTITNSPVTTSGTLTGTFKNQLANQVWASPNGISGAPAFRSLTYTDFPLSGASAGTYGSDTTIPQFTVNSQGIITAVGELPINSRYLQDLQSVTAIGNKTDRGISVTGSDGYDFSDGLWMNWTNSLGTLTYNADGETYGQLRILNDGRTIIQTGSGAWTQFLPSTGATDLAAIFPARVQGERATNPKDLVVFDQVDSLMKYGLLSNLSKNELITRQKINLNPTSNIYLLGDSYMFGVGASATERSLAQVIVHVLGDTNFNNYAASGTGALYAAYQGFNRAITNTTRQCIAWCGYNDIRRTGLTQKGLGQYTNGLRSLIANQFLTTAIPGSSGSITYGSGWTLDYPSTLSGGKAQLGISGFGAQTTTASTTATYTFSGTNIVIGTFGSDGSTVMDSFYVYIDGSLYRGYNFNNTYSGVADLSPFDQKIGPAVVVIQNLSTGSHTLQIVKGNSTNKLIIDYLGTLNAPASCASIVIAEIPYFTQSQYNAAFVNYGAIVNDSIVNVFNYTLRNLVREFNGYPATTAPSNSYISVPSDSYNDSTHLNDTGHLHAAQAVLSVITPASANLQTITSSGNTTSNNIITTGVITSGGGSRLSAIFKNFIVLGNTVGYDTVGKKNSYGIGWGDLTSTGGGILSHQNSTSNFTTTFPTEFDNYRGGNANPENFIRHGPQIGTYELGVGNGTVIPRVALRLSYQSSADTVLIPGISSMNGKVFMTALTQNKLSTDSILIINAGLVKKANSLSQLYIDGLADSLLKRPDTTLVRAMLGGGSSWSVNGSNIYNNNAGNVGIGTGSLPSAKLHINGSFQVDLGSDTKWQMMQRDSATGRMVAITAGTLGQFMISGFGGKNSFRSLAASDIPALPFSNITGTVPVSQGGTGLTALGTALQQLRVNAGATALEYFTPLTPISLKDFYADETGVDSVMKYIISPTYLANNGDKVVVKYSGSFAATSGTAHDVGINVASTLFGMSNGTGASGEWDIESTIIRVSNTTVRVSTKMLFDNTGTDLLYQNTGDITGLNLSLLGLRISVNTGSPNTNVIAKLGGIIYYPAAP